MHPYKKAAEQVVSIDGASSVWEAREILTGEKQKRNHVSY